MDIVALDGETLVFIEVKTRIGSDHGLPQEAIQSRKLYALKHGAYYYKMLHPKLGESLRIDVVSVLISSDERVQKIDLFRNITL